jgi:hypothetical protein
MTLNFVNDLREGKEIEWGKNAEIIKDRTFHHNKEVGVTVSD